MGNIFTARVLAFFVIGEKLKNKIKKAKPIIFKVNEETRELLQKNADVHASGNLSAWLRHAGLHYKPHRHFKARTKRSVEDFY